MRERLVAICGPEAVRCGLAERSAHAEDCWPLLVMRRRAEAHAQVLPEIVVWPRCTAQVQAIVRAWREHQTPLVPYGGGSGVCGGAVPARAGSVSIDLKRMDRLIEVRDRTLLCEVEAGMNGMVLERELESRGYTLGHVPSSLMCLTIGGAIATRSSGQASTRYGSIEHLVAGLDVVLPDAEVVVLRPVPRTATAIDWRNVFCGSEGVLGIVTRAWLRLQPRPAATRMLAYRFPDVASGLEAFRRIVQRGHRPAVMRLYDPLDTLLGVAGGATRRRVPEALARVGKQLMHRAESLLLAHPRGDARPFQPRVP